jgi:hypothetical protein
MLAAPPSSLRNFSFVIEAQLAGSDVPRIRADFEAWHARGVRAVLNVHTHTHAQLYHTGADAFAAEVVPFGFRCMHVPVEDLTAPTQAQIADSVAFIRACIGALGFQIWSFSPTFVRASTLVEAQEFCQNFTIILYHNSL